MSFREQDQGTKTPGKFPIPNLWLSVRTVIRVADAVLGLGECWEAVL